VRKRKQRKLRAVLTGKYESIESSVWQRRRGERGKKKNGSQWGHSEHEKGGYIKKAAYRGAKSVRGTDRIISTEEKRNRRQFVG